MEIPKRLTKLQKDALATMPFIVAGNQSEIGYIFTDAFTTDFLIELGFAEINSEIKDAEGNVATRATQYGISYVKGLEVSITPSVEGETPKGEVKMTTEATAEFVIEAGIEVPKIKRTGAIGNSKYPFGKLEVGQSFLIPRQRSQVTCFDRCQRNRPLCRCR